MALTLGFQALGVFDGGCRVVDGTRANHHQQTVVLPGHDLVNVLARLGNQRFHGGAADGEKANQVFGRREHGDVLDAFVVGLAGFVDGRMPRLGFGGTGGGVHGDSP